MAEAQKSTEIGMRRGRILSSLSQSRQLDIIAEGMPILFKSAGELLDASCSLGEQHRAARVLQGHAMEEIAKILILMDIVRCPPNLRPSRIGAMMGWFYDHLARLIYVDAQSWKPQDISQLQDYIDSHRRSHFLEGTMSEYILPNWTIYSRESLLYADIIAHEDGEPVWNEPMGYEPVFGQSEPGVWQLCKALRDMGAVTREGLDKVSSVWSQVNFADAQNWCDSERLTYEMLKALDAASLISDKAREEQLAFLYHRWQLPMYHLDFKRIEVPLSDLRAQRDAELWSQVGY